MNYELAKQLKDAGFSQSVGRYLGRIYFLLDGTQMGFVDMNSIRRDDIIIAPNLSELIEACGEDFRMLEHVSDGFICFLPPRLSVTAYTVGSTPEEAVARLWLAINKHVRTTINSQLDTEEPTQD